MQAPLPATADAEGKADTRWNLMVTDPLKANRDRIRDITLRLLVSDLAAEGLPAEGRIAPARMWTYSGHPEMNVPPGKGIEHWIEIRINNLLLPTPRIMDGWLIFNVHPGQVARGDNLVGIRVTGHPQNDRQQIRVELAVGY